MSTSAILWSKFLFSLTLSSSSSSSSSRLYQLHHHYRCHCDAKKPRRKGASSCVGSLGQGRPPVRSPSLFSEPSRRSSFLSFLTLHSSDMSSTDPVLPQDAPAHTPLKTLNVRIKGKVQGVFYRNWTVDTAKQLGLKGWVRNRRDGSVEAVFSGDAAVVDSMIRKCYWGPELAKVSGLDVSPWDGSLPEEFERRPTEW